MIQIIIVCYLLFFFDPPFESAKIWGIFGLPIRQGLPDWLGQVAANNEPCHKIRYPRYLMCMFGLYPYWGSYPHYEPYQHNMVISFLFRSLMEEPFPKGHGVFFFLFVGELSVADPTAQERHPLQSLLVSSTEVARLPCAWEFAKLAAKTWNNLRGSTWRLPVGFCLIRCGKRGIGWFPCEVSSNIVGQ